MPTAFRMQDNYNAYVIIYSVYTVTKTDISLSQNGHNDNKKKVAVAMYLRLSFGERT